MLYEPHSAGGGCGKLQRGAHQGRCEVGRGIAVAAQPRDLFAVFKQEDHKEHVGENGQQQRGNLDIAGVVGKIGQRFGQRPQRGEHHKELCFSYEIPAGEKGRAA